MQDKTIEIEKVRDKAVKEEALKKKLYVVGIGPGAYEQMTIRAAQVLEECSVIAGYTVYIDLIKEHFPRQGISYDADAAGEGTLSDGS